MSIGPLSLLVVLAAAAFSLLWIYQLRRRDLRSIDHLSRQIQHIARGRNAGRIEGVGPDHLTGLISAINQLVAHPPEGTRGKAPDLFTSLGERIYQVVLVHREVILYANRQFAELVGRDRTELVGRPLADLVAPEYADLVKETIHRHLTGEPAAGRYEVEVPGRDGLSRLEISSELIEYEGGRALLMTGTEIVPAQPPESSGSGLGAPALRHYSTLDQLAEAVIVTDVSGAITYLNASAERLSATPASQALGKGLDEIMSLVEETDRRLLAEPIRQTLASGVAVNLGRRALLVSRTDGSERSIELSASPVRDAAGRLTGALVLLHDVSELRGIARQMSYQATHDALTGLVNRHEFERRLQEAAESGYHGDGQHVLCCLDLDRFKVVNDTSGHLAGDSVLREVAKVLRDAVRDSDTVARLGGDEFGMLLIGCPLDKARQIADDVCHAVGDHRFVWRDKLFNLGVSVGLVEISRESGTIEELLAAADSACYVAKKQGSGKVAVYSARDEVLARHSGEIQWLQKLQVALRENRFQLYQQPIVAAYGDDTAGPVMEIFVHLEDEGGEAVSPAEFVRAAERYRLMGFVDRWVVQTTLTALGRGALHVAPGHCVAINISGQTLGDESFLEFVVECLDSTGVQPPQVCFELSESSVVANLEHARRFVGVLHGMGCRFALDDFGSGVGSFSNLRSLPMDYLKIDGSFIRNLSHDSVNQAMVSAMIELARTLNFKVIAEQVEDNAALEVARRMGIDYLQGYAIARPKLLPLAA